MVLRNVVALAPDRIFLRIQSVIWLNSSELEIVPELLLLSLEVEERFLRILE